MDWPVYSVKDLSRYSGRPEASYPDYADEAVTQSLLLFQLASTLSDFPSTRMAQDLARLGILAMADLLVLSQPHQAAMATPFQSETIGSYSYSKVQAKISAGQPTGVMWFDLAVSRLGSGIDNMVSSEAITVFEHDHPSRVINGRRTAETFRRVRLGRDPSVIGFFSGDSSYGGGMDSGFGMDDALGVGEVVGESLGGELVGAVAPTVAYGGGLYFTRTAELVVPANPGPAYALPFDTTEVLGTGDEVTFNRDAGTLTVQATGLYKVSFDVLFLADETSNAVVSLVQADQPGYVSTPIFPGSTLPSAVWTTGEAAASVEALLYQGNSFYVHLAPAESVTVTFAEFTIQRIG